VPDERRPAAILLNRGAASAGSRRVRRAVALAREALDADLHEADTRDASELTRWMDERVGGYRTVVVAGGDGSLAAAYNLLAGRQDVAIGYIPGGFGNATAHLLRLPRDPAELAAVLARGRPRAVDLVEVEGRLALFAGVGWDALVAERYAASGARRLPGWAAAVARSVPDLVRRRQVQVEADGALVHSGPLELLVVSVTPWYGRGLLVNPGARPDRGRVTLRVYPGPLPRFAVEATRWMARRSPGVPGSDATNVVVRAADARPIRVQADGDVIGARAEWRFAVRPAAVRLIGDW
jgi:diacylglycerol kinase family enzyme